LIERAGREVGTGAEKPPQEEVAMFVRTEEAGRYRPHLVIAHSEPDYVASAERLFRQHGWAVLAAETGPQARRLARAVSAALVVLEADLPAESGWLTCAKLVQEVPGSKVVLVGRDRDGYREDLAAFVGASALVGAHEGAAALMQEAVANAASVA
jgi:hypothetical protein